MKIPRFLAVLLGAALAALAVAFIKALAVGGLSTLPPLKVLLFAASTFGLVAAMLDWALFRDLRKNVRSLEREPKKTLSAEPSKRSKLPAVVAEAAAASSNPPPPNPVIQRARLHPIVFREIVSPSSSAGLSFYGGLPVGPANFSWPRLRNKPGDAPLSFIIQWDCAELAAQDHAGLVPTDGVLYLFADLTWGDPFDYQFMHSPGPVEHMETLSAPPDLPPVYGDEGAYQVSYCSPHVVKEQQDVPRLLPKWPFRPIAFTYPVPEKLADGGRLFWSENQAVAEALLRVEHPDGTPPLQSRDQQQPLPFARPFPEFPHDYAAVRAIAAKVLHDLHRPPTWLLREIAGHEREALFQAWRDQATQQYVSSAAQPPAARVGQSRSDEIWRWMEGLQPLLRLGWGTLVEECVDLSLGLGSNAVGALPANLLAAVSDRHELASAYLRKEARTLHAPCPNHMLGPPSFVQGYVEEYLEDWVLLLELSSRKPIGLGFGEGVLQFMIRPDDLRNRRFDQVMLVASAY